MGLGLTRAEHGEHTGISHCYWSPAGPDHASSAERERSERVEDQFALSRKIWEKDPTVAEMSRITRRLGDEILWSFWALCW